MEARRGNTSPGPRTRPRSGSERVSIAEAADRARLATEDILAAMESAPRGVVVDSPPGAGKSTLVVRAAARLAGQGHRVMIIAQTNEQVDDLTAAVARSLDADGGQAGSGPA